MFVGEALAQRDQADGVESGRQELGVGVLGRGPGQGQEPGEEPCGGARRTGGGGRRGEGRGPFRSRARRGSRCRGGGSGGSGGKCLRRVAEGRRRHALGGHVGKGQQGPAGRVGHGLGDAARLVVPEGGTGPDVGGLLQRAVHLDAAGRERDEGGRVARAEHRVVRVDRGDGDAVEQAGEECGARRIERLLAGAFDAGECAAVGEAGDPGDVPVVAAVVVADPAQPAVQPGARVDLRTGLQEGGDRFGRRFGGTPGEVPAGDEGFAALGVLDGERAVARHPADHARGPGGDEGRWKRTSATPWKGTPRRAAPSRRKSNQATPGSITVRYTACWAIGVSPGPKTRAKACPPASASSGASAVGVPGSAVRSGSGRSRAGPSGWATGSSRLCQGRPAWRAVQSIA